MQSARWLEALCRGRVSPWATWILLQGSSMEPTYGHGDTLLVESLVGAPPVQPGEVVVARRGNSLVTHRVVSLSNGMATTKGDACARVDPPLPLGALLGRVVGSRPGPRRFPGARWVNHMLRGSLRLTAEVLTR